MKLRTFFISRTKQIHIVINVYVTATAQLENA